MASYQDQIESLIAYVESGQPLGSYTTALLANDLMDAVGRADAISLHSLREVCSYIHTLMPRESFGSRARVAAWIAKGGMRTYEPKYAERISKRLREPLQRLSSSELGKTEKAFEFLEKTIEFLGERGDA